MTDTVRITGRPNWPAFLAGAAAMVLLAGGAWLWARRHPPPRVMAPAPPAPPLASGVFDDGVTVEIMEAKVAASFAHTIPRPALAPAAADHASQINLVGLESTVDETDWKRGAALKIYHEDNRCAKAETLTLSGEPALVMLLRLRDHRGRALWISGDNDEHSSARPEPGSPPHERVRLEVEDGAGGWLACDGPEMFDGQGGLCFAQRLNFPRRKTTLRLRARRAGRDDVPLEIPNPGHEPPYPTRTPNIAPVVTAEFRVEFLGLQAWPGTPPRLLPRFAFEPAPGFKRSDFRLRYELLDATGNHAAVVGEHSGPHSFEWLPGEPECRAVCLVSRSLTYPWKMADLTVVGEGVLEDKPLAKLVVTSQGGALGISRIHAENRGNPARPDFGTVMINAEHLAPGADSRHALGMLVGFGDGGEVVGTGTDLSARWGGFDGGRGDWLIYQWTGKLAAGKQVRLAFAPRTALEPKRFEFVTEVLPASSTEPGGQ